MRTFTSCPDPREIDAFLQAQQSEEEIEALALHLEHCPGCAAAVDGVLLPGEDVAASLRAETAKTWAAEEAEIQGLIVHLQSLRPPVAEETLDSFAPLDAVTEDGRPTRLDDDDIGVLLAEVR